MPIPIYFPSVCRLAGVFGLIGCVFLPVGAQASSRDYCREYTRTVHIGGQMENAYGTACLQANGDWVIVGEELALQSHYSANQARSVIVERQNIVVPQRVVYRNTRVVPTTSFIWYQGGAYHGSRHGVYHRVYHRPALQIRGGHYPKAHDQHHVRQKVHKGAHKGLQRHGGSARHHRHDDRRR